MTDLKTEAGVFSDSLAPAAGPGGDGESAVRLISGEDHVVRPSACAGTEAVTVLEMDFTEDGGRKPELMPRSEADDERIALHEIGGHALVSVLLHSPLGGVSIEPADSDGHSGLCWGPKFRSKFAGGPDEPTLCAQIGPLMPGPGESRA